MIRIFIAYSSKDLVFKDEIRIRLRPLQRAGKVDIWDNYNIEAGKDWDAEVREKLENADLILLLLSPDALDSDYFYEVEAPIALRRHEVGEAIAVGILLRPCSFRHTPFEFGKYEMLPKKGYPVTDRRWRTFDDAYLSIFEEVDVLVEKIEARNSIGVTPSHPDTTHIQPQNGQVIRDIPDGPEMVFVEGGTFQMGSNEYGSEKPIHHVTVHSFWMCKYPITFDEYDAYCFLTGKEKPKDQGWGRGLRPVINVNWEDAQEYGKWLSEKTGAQYRLLSEAEWEFAARGGKRSKGIKYAGSNNLDEVGWYSENSDSKTHPVGEKKANESGLHDMSGNVWEWCQDNWHENYRAAPADGSVWVAGGDKTIAMLRRGGSWNYHDVTCRVSYRNWLNRDLRFNDCGFRLARAAGRA